MARPERIHVAHPFGEIEGDREQGQDSDQRMATSTARAALKPKPCSASTRVASKICATVLSFGYRQRPDRHRPADQPGQHEAADDHDVARNDEDDQRDRQRAGDAQRNIDRHDQRLVGERVEIGAELARHVEALGKKAIDRVADPGRQEQRRKATRISPDMIAQTTTGTSMMRAKRNEVRNTQTTPRLPAPTSRDASLCPLYSGGARACAPGDSDVGGAEQSRPAGEGNLPNWWLSWTRHATRPPASISMPATAWWS